MTEILISDIHKQFSDVSLPALNSVSLTIASGRITALLGASGSGKTTLLKIIAGLLSADRGDILFNGQSVTKVATEQRGAVMVFQDNLLFPHMTIEQNIGFGLKIRGIAKHVIRQRVQQMLDLIQLPDVGKRRPHQLSGGQQQRIALARALMVEPKVLLLDEPLSSLDVHLRDEMRDLIRHVQQAFRITTVIVTHDQQDAVAIADEIVLMRQGSVEQVGVPDILFNQPANEYIARFFGGVNFVNGYVDANSIHTDMGVFQIEKCRPSGNVLMTIRPEHIQICTSACTNALKGTIESLQYMGTYWRYVIRLTRQEHKLTVHVNNIQYSLGDPVFLYLPPENLWTIS